MALTPEEKRHRDATWAELYYHNHSELKKEPKMAKVDPVKAEVVRRIQGAITKEFEGDGRFDVKSPFGLQMDIRFKQPATIGPRLFSVKISEVLS